jgi:Uma2 family endonuclease
MPPTTSQLLTAEDLWRMPNDGTRRALMRGELRTTTPSGADHGGVTVNFTVALAVHVRSRGLGEVFAAETGFRLSRDPDTVVGADVAFVRAERIPPEGRPKGFWEGAPDLAVETLSPSDTVEEVEEKVDAYLAAGARVVLTLNPKRKTITVHKSAENPIILHVGETLDLDDVVPGFKCPVADVFV